MTILSTPCRQNWNGGEEEINKSWRRNSKASIKCKHFCHPFCRPCSRCRCDAPQTNWNNKQGQKLSTWKLILILWRPKVWQHWEWHLNWPVLAKHLLISFLSPFSVERNLKELVISLPWFDLFCNEKKSLEARYNKYLTKLVFVDNTVNYRTLLSPP